MARSSTQIERPNDGQGPEAQYASREAVEEALGDMPDAFVECRDFQHRWTAYTASWNAQEGVFDRSLRCTRCRTKKIQILDSTGGVIRSHYDYPDNYLLKDLGRIVGDGRDAVRLASVMRQLNKNGALPEFSYG